jgi:xanthine dehydrogenase accessory factor
MLVSERGEVRGSLSGGCVEGAVFAACTEAIASGLPRREHFGYSDDDAFAAGLLCGGSLEVHIQPFYPRGATGAFPPAAELPTAVDVSAGCALVRRIDGQSTGTILVDDPLGFDPASIAPELLSLLGEPGMARSAAAQLEPLVRAGHTGVIRLAPGRRGCRDQPVELFVESRLPAPLMLVYGANDFAAALTRAAKPLGYRITLCDARAAFATPAAFPQADDVVIQWPHAHLDALSAGGPVDPRTVVCVLTHDAKFDIPVLRRALEMGFAYVGAMGSRASDRQRRAALVEAGVAPEQLARLRSPIGLDLGASSPQEVAVSIVAEILAARHGKNVPRPLSQVAGPIH